MTEYQLMEESFSKEFYRRVEDLKKRAQAAGTNITALCRESGVSRTTPERWEKRVPKSIEIVDLMYEALVKIEKAHEEERKRFESLSPNEQARIKLERIEQERAEEEERRAKRNAARRRTRQAKKPDSK